MSSTAVFFDRDGTLIRDPGYISHPDQVELLDGAADALKEMQLLGYKTVVVSNQPGVAKGILTEETLEQVHSRLRDLISQAGGSLDIRQGLPIDQAGFPHPAAPGSGQVSHLHDRGRFGARVPQQPGQARHDLRDAARPQPPAQPPDGGFELARDVMRRNSTRMDGVSARSPIKSSCRS